MLHFAFLLSLNEVFTVQKMRLGTKLTLFQEFVKPEPVFVVKFTTVDGSCLWSCEFLFFFSIWETRCNYWNVKLQNTPWVLRLSFLSAILKSRKATISLDIFVCPLFRMEKLGSHSTNLHEKLYLEIFRKLRQKIQISFKSDKYNGQST
jgi:hypothetical protein